MSVIRRIALALMLATTIAGCATTVDYRNLRPGGFPVVQTRPGEHVLVEVNVSPNMVMVVCNDFQCARDTTTGVIYAWVPKALIPGK